MVGVPGKEGVVETAGVQSRLCTRDWGTCGQDGTPSPPHEELACFTICCMPWAEQMGRGL